MKSKSLFLAASLVLTASSDAFAAVDDTFVVDGLLYTVLTESDDDNTVNVRKPLNDFSLSGDIVIPSEVSNGETTYTVTALAASAFSYCSDLKSVYVPATVTTIPDGDVFARCTSLEAVNVDPESASFSSENGVLYNKNKTLLLTCPKTLTGEFTIPASVKTLAAFCFTDCTKLTSIPIPATVTALSSGCFIRCTSLTSLTIPATTSFNTNAYIAFEAPALESITVDEGNTIICSVDGVLYNKAMTRLIQYPAAKAGEVSIPESVTNYGPYCLSGVKELTAINIPKGVTLSYNALVLCPNLTEINVDEENANYCSEDGVLFSKDKTSLTTFPAGRTGEYTVPDGITELYQSAFRGSKLTTIELPSSLTTFGTAVFQECTNLTKLTFNNPTPPSSFTRSYFWGTLEELTLYVPEESVEAYKEALPYMENIKAIGEASIEEIATDCEGAIDFTKPLKVYDLSGKKIADNLHNLAAGIYIVKQGEKSAKVAVK